MCRIEEKMIPFDLWTLAPIKALLKKHATIRKPVPCGTGKDISCFNIGKTKVLKVVCLRPDSDPDYFCPDDDPEYFNKEDWVAERRRRTKHLQNILHFYNNPNPAVARIIDIKQITPDFWAYVQIKKDIHDKKEYTRDFCNYHYKQIKNSLSKDPLFLDLEWVSYFYFGLTRNKAVLLDLGSVVLRSKKGKI
jgi:hypothetical protein